MLRYGILGILGYRSATGYELNEIFKNSLDFFWTATTSQIYRELNRLEEKGLVRKRKVEQTGKPDKNVFSITEEGKKEFLSWLSSPAPGLEQKVPVLLKVFFLGIRSPEENIRFFENIEEILERGIKELSPVPEIIEGYGKEGLKSQTLYWQMTLDYGLRRMKMEKEWAAACIEKIRERKE